MDIIIYGQKEARGVTIRIVKIISKAELQLEELLDGKGIQTLLKEDMEFTEKQN